MPLKNRAYQILVVTDNHELLAEFKKVVATTSLPKTKFSYRYSSINKKFAKRFASRISFKPIDLDAQIEEIIRSFDLIISLHSKKIFPHRLVHAVRCINVHPGYNPHTRGWYPQIFAIIEKLTLGATIHEMDTQVDHGPIIARTKVPVYGWDTSLSAYNRVRDAEIDLIKINLKKIITGKYRAKSAHTSGTIHYQHDFQNLRKISLTQKGTFGEFIDRLRALSHGDYKNAYFIDPKTKKRVTLKLELYIDEK